MSTPSWIEEPFEDEAVAHFTVDWVEDDLQKTPLVEVELIDEADVLRLSDGSRGCPCPSPVRRTG